MRQVISQTKRSDPTSLLFIHLCAFCQEHFKYKISWISDVQSWHRVAFSGTETIASGNETFVLFKYIYFHGGTKDNDEKSVRMLEF
jgi:hypothetical protein